MNEPISEAARRRTALVKEIEHDRKSALFSAYANHYLSILLLLCALGFSVAAGALGFFTNYSSKIVGGFAVLPALIAFAAVNLKCEAKNGWHARRADALGSLRSRLLYQVPEQPTIEQIAIIAKDRDLVEAEMQKEWEKTLVVTWDGFRQSHRKS